MKLSPIIWPKTAYEHVGTLRTRTEEGLWIQQLPTYLESALESLGMTECNVSTSPKLEKATEDGDDEPFEKPAEYRSAVCTMIYPAKRCPHYQATVRWMCQMLQHPDKKSGHQLVTFMRFAKGAKGVGNILSIRTRRPMDNTIDQGCLLGRRRSRSQKCYGRSRYVRRLPPPFALARNAMRCHIEWTSRTYERE